jgi:truncated hemoglobin YjbI
MKEVHKNMGLTDMLFSHLVEHLVQGMNDLKVPRIIQHEILSMVNPLREHIVTVSMYKTLGEEQRITDLCFKLYDKIYKEPQVNEFFQHFEKNRVATQMSKFLCQAFGGPAK